MRAKHVIYVIIISVILVGCSNKSDSSDFETVDLNDTGTLEATKDLTKLGGSVLNVVDVNINSTHVVNNDSEYLDLLYFDGQQMVYSINKIGSDNVWDETIGLYSYDFNSQTESLIYEPESNRRIISYLEYNDESFFSIINTETSKNVVESTILRGEEIIFSGLIANIQSAPILYKNEYGVYFSCKEYNEDQTELKSAVYVYSDSELLELITIKNKVINFQVDGNDPYISDTQLFVSKNTVALYSSEGSMLKYYFIKDKEITVREIERNSNQASGVTIISLHNKVIYGEYNTSGVYNLFDFEGQEEIITLDDSYYRAIEINENSFAYINSLEDLRVCTLTSDTYQMSRVLGLEKGFIKYYTNNGKMFIQIEMTAEKTNKFYLLDLNEIPK